MQYEERFSKRLIQLRMQKGVSAREMSLSIGQNASYINNIETGKALPSMNGFFYICEYLNISPQEFFNETAEAPRGFLLHFSVYRSGANRETSEPQMDLIQGYDLIQWLSISRDFLMVSKISSRILSTTEDL